MAFDGATFDSDRDESRLTAQLVQVRDLMLDGQWRTLTELEERTGHPQASISARLRDLRKPRFGGFNVEREYVERGLFRYRVVPEQPAVAEVPGALFGVEPDPTHKARSPYDEED